MKYFIELTSKEHGGKGWTLGDVLWSPVGSSWNNSMNEPEPGDLIIHAVTHNNAKHFYGLSKVSKKVTVTTDKPTTPGKWSDHDKFYRIELIDFEKFNFELVKIQDFLNDNQERLEAIAPQKSFYNEKGNIKTSQGKYLSRVSEELFKIITEYLKIEEASINKYIEFSSDNNGRVTSDDENRNPTRVETTINRIVRDTKLIKDLKTEFNNECQICGKKTRLLSGNYYSEGHHIKPLGGTHSGPDIRENVIILCANHHIEFDYGLITIVGNIINHIDVNNDFHLKEIKYERADNNTYLDYHTEHIFKKGQ